MEDPDDQPSVLEQIRDSLQDKAQRTRSGDSCDHCGTSEGSTVHDREKEWTLCRECMNDPDILGKYVE